MGIHTSGVYTPQDSRSKYVRILGELAQLPAGDLSKNYLNQDLLIDTAKALRADAVHPGYGFLAENPDFAEKILQSGLLWVGPRTDAMRALGDKIRAKEIAAQVGVPVAPWTRLSGGTDAGRVVEQIGLPLLIKAAHGGGGRGQRVVTDASQFAEALRSAGSEALRSFGSAEVFVERFLDHPRHIEVQILGDDYGNIFTLGERDCTLQRRNQKVIEESPATVLDPTTRGQICEAAKALATAVGYTNAGTIEFLAQKSDSGKWEFFFMELNARLQVEHPITELLWNVDLVELQLRIAEHENLQSLLNPVPAVPIGHAIEVRLCAENPENHFLPTPGPVTEIRIPLADDLRVDSGFDAGDVIAQEYDSLFAKLIVHAPTREQAIARLTTLLDETLVAGILTNKYYLRSVLSHPDFQGNTHFTRWIDLHPDRTAVSAAAIDGDLVYWGKKLSSELLVQRKSRSDFSVPPRTKVLTDFLPLEGVYGESSPQGLIRLAGDFEVRGEERVYASGWISRFELCLSFQREIDGVGQRTIAFAGQFEVDELRAHHGPIVAQVPGVVLDIRVKTDEIVPPLEPILVIEAMKIEMPLSLPISAKITAIHVRPGDRIQPGQTLVTWEPAA